MSNENGSFDSNNFVISFELLALLQWLLEHEQESCRKLIRRAVKQGFNVKDVGLLQYDNPQDLQQNIIDFLALIDTQLHETINECEAEGAMHRTLLPTINNVDPSMHDVASISTSIAKARAAAEKESGNPKDIFCKELLRRWKPKKKKVIIQ